MLRGGGGGGQHRSEAQLSLAPRSPPGIASRHTGHTAWMNSRETGCAHVNDAVFDVTEAGARFRRITI
jgi:hypothetical protein